MPEPPIRCLVLACGNSLRGDDGAGPWLAAWAEERFRNHSGIRIISRQQWMPELTADLAAAQVVLFIDSSIESPPGAIRVEPVSPSAQQSGLLTHHLNPAELLSLQRGLYNSLPQRALLLTIGIAAMELGEGLSGPVRAALPNACAAIEEAVFEMLGNPNL